MLSIKAVAKATDHLQSRLEACKLFRHPDILSLHSKHDDRMAHMQIVALPIEPIETEVISCSRR
jgi:hypothetical protein